jgi:signal transduction histidine kinase
VTRSKILTHERFARTAAPDPAQRELNAIREILHAYLNADRPEEAFQFALDRVSPLIGASFASVYLVDGVSELMRLAAAFNWPARYRPWLGEMRVRIGFGPSGEAVSERRMIEVPDVATDKTLEDWAEVASELGFRSLVALPLQSASGALGTVTFYFTEAGSPTAEKRNLMRLLADQMAATAEKVRGADELRRTRAALTEANAELETQYAAVLEARRGKDEFLANASEQLRAPLGAVMAALDRATEPGADLTSARRAAAELQWNVDELLEYAALRAGSAPIELDSFDASEAVTAASRLMNAHPLPVALRFEGQAASGPRMRSDRRKITRLLASLVVTAGRWVPGGEVSVSIEDDNDHVRYRVHTTGSPGPRDDRETLLPEYRSVDGLAGRAGLGVALATQLARVLGGAVDVDTAAGEGVTFLVRLPMEAAVAG